MFSLLDIVFSIGVVQGLLLSFSLFFFGKKVNTSNIPLAKMLLIVSALLLGRIVLIHFGNEIIWKIAVVLDSGIFLIGPYLYEYIKKISERNSAIFQLKQYHYVLFFAHVIYAIVFALTSKENLLALYQNGTLSKINFLIELLGILSIGFYIFYTYRLFKNLKKLEQVYFSNRTKILNFIKIFLVLSICCLSYWLLSFITNQLNTPLVFSYDLMWLFTTLLLVWAALYNYIYPNLIRFENISLPQKNTTPRLTNDISDALKEKLLIVMEQEKPYLEPDLKLSELAEQLSVSNNDLSWLINSAFNMTFYQFINQYRLKDFIKKVEKGEIKKHNILGLAMEVGFNSKSTFNKYFKTIYQTTPKAYIQNLDNQVQLGTKKRLMIKS